VTDNDRTRKNGTKKERKKRETKTGSTAEHPEDSLGRRTTGSTARVRRIVAVAGHVVGIAALLVAIGAVYWLLTFTASGNRISSAFPDDVGGTTTMSFPFLMAMLAMIGLFFGQFAVRGRWGVGARVGQRNGFFQVTLQPLSVASHAVLLVLALLAWVLVLVVPVYLDVRGEIEALPGSSAVEQFWFTVTIYGVVTGVVSAMIAVSLLKKLTYNRSLRRAGRFVVPGSARQKVWRKFSHIYRGELGIAGFAGAALGLSPLGIHLDSALYGFSMLAAGLVLSTVSITLALNSWRSGLPLERLESYT
jgi:hypothetical protein